MFPPTGSRPFFNGFWFFGVGQQYVLQPRSRVGRRKRGTETGEQHHGRTRHLSDDPTSVAAELRVLGADDRMRQEPKVHVSLLPGAMQASLFI